MKRRRKAWGGGGGRIDEGQGRTHELAISFLAPCQSSLDPSPILELLPPVCTSRRRIRSSPARVVVCRQEEVSPQRGGLSSVAFPRSTCPRMTLYWTKGPSFDVVVTQEGSPHTGQSAASRLREDSLRQSVRTCLDTSSPRQRQMSGPSFRCRLGSGAEPVLVSSMCCRLTGGQTSVGRQSSGELVDGLADGLSAALIGLAAMESITWFSVACILPSFVHKRA